MTTSLLHFLHRWPAATAATALPPRPLSPSFSSSLLLLSLSPFLSPLLLLLLVDCCLLSVPPPLLLPPVSLLPLRQVVVERCCQGAAGIVGKHCHQGAAGVVVEHRHQEEAGIVVERLHEGMVSVVVSHRWWSRGMSVVVGR
jgi:hypothetical protein